MLFPIESEIEKNWNDEYGDTDGADSSCEERDRTRLLITSSSFCSTISLWRHHAVNDGNINPSLLPNGAVLQNPADAAAAAGPRPHVLLEPGPAVRGLEGVADAVLSFPYHLLEAGPHWRRRRRMGLIVGFSEKGFGALSFWGLFLDGNGGSHCSFSPKGDDFGLNWRVGPPSGLRPTE